MSVRTVPVNRTIYFRVPDEVADKFEDFVRGHDLNRNLVARNAIVGYMDSWTSGKAKDSSDKTKTR